MPLVVRTGRLQDHRGKAGALDVSSGPFAPGAACWETTPETFAAVYRLEMRALYRDQRALWDELLARPLVLLLCACDDPAGRCHRTLLAGFLVKLGAIDEGEQHPGIELGRGEGCVPFVVRDDAGQVLGGGIVCRGRTRRRCKVPGCGDRAPILCDGKLTGSKAGKTCDMPLCRKHAKRVGADEHLCPVHYDIAMARTE